MVTPSPLPSLPPRKMPKLTPTVPSAKAKGKQRAVESETESDDDAGDYPPGHDDYDETKRIEETLKRWDMAEKQRRKSVRESAGPLVSASGSVVSSMLWSTPKARTGYESASRDSVDVVPLTTMPNSPTTASSPQPDDPFVSPEEHDQPPNSPFADAHQRDSIMHASRKPSLNIFDGAKQSPPPPITLPPSPTSQPSITSQPIRAEDSPSSSHPWWHEWLCGCGEGPDRGGDYQAGRTNPNE
ncbi:hypothetical protein DL96DRAFT_1602674 [Flagelloscypha sp. PMI_526]|nr:hypothetical protein DL96DRAFT_1602674 [Flagelloscypha sp. PMI_526]